MPRRRRKEEYYPRSATPGSSLYNRRLTTQKSKRSYKEPKDFLRRRIASKARGPILILGGKGIAYAGARMEARAMRSGAASRMATGAGRGAATAATRSGTRMTLLRGAAFTGRMAGRAVPVVGWAVLAYDVYTLSSWAYREFSQD